MKKSYALSFLLLITVQSMVAENMKRSFQTVCTDIRAVMKGNASPEQKERLIKQGAAMFLAFSISLYCVSALGAMWDGQKVPPIKVRGALGRADSSLTKRAPQDVPPLETSDSIRGFFDLKPPPADSVLRDDSCVLDEDVLEDSYLLRSDLRAMGARGRKLPTRNGRPKKVRTVSGRNLHQQLPDMPERLFG